MGLSKHAFWNLTFSRGMDSRTHTHFWNLYCKLGQESRSDLRGAISSMPQVRDPFKTKASA